MSCYCGFLGVVLVRWFDLFLQAVLLGAARGETRGKNLGALNVGLAWIFGS
jgi:hypothetical protein